MSGRPEPAQTYEDHLEAVRKHNLTNPTFWETPLTRKRFALRDQRNFSSARFKVTCKKGALIDSRGKLVDTSGSRWNFVFSRDGVFLCESKMKSQDRTVSHGVLASFSAVFSAGEIVVDNGKVVYVDNRTGAYRLPPVLLEQFRDHLKKQGVLDRTFVLNFHTRDVMFLTPTEILMFNDAAIPVSDRYLTLLKIGRQEISRKLARLRAVDRQTGRDELLGLQDFFIKVRHLDEFTDPVGETMLAIIENDDLSVSIRVRFLYNFYRNVSYLNMDHVVRELNRIRTKESLDEKLARGIAASLNEIASLEPLDA